ncbi:HpcH/HpaI aldolase/citrate lyase family protein [Streptomyces griseus]|uniref:HpcH/HpaI aldolase/citrate lyase family protein n=1 Tax=Streptomyces TaxID=1883 RepID=UPI0004C8403C|nr:MULTISPECIES: CoA ester lyase [Streptomyces]MYR09322.1 CoA ester lyase [Streptomyces sp. SID724]MYT78921.1 CoA ester lyase [Streptomyces sp. SID8364]NEB53503.1 CoA ester lyase [Streptomyces griseus]SBU93924.1 citrate lyase subunit beta / citryl-CoA lyase [Streptomyces sp. MnatMP-M77]SCE38822.1 citrate lyase subunit beta / citryl-CoA lyase/(S)-citramalyl-CoA lyase [Streptomyces sp. OspMP-M43]
MTGATRAIPRSILYTPALSPEKVVKAWSYDADVHLIDLEDSVPPADKQAARAVCRAALEKSPRPAGIAVRINELGSLAGIQDVQTLADSPVRPGIVLMTMVTTADEVDLLRRMLASAGASPEIYVTVETVEAVTRVDSIARSADGLVLGSADLAATLGVDISWEAMLAARQAMAMACARYGTACVDTANYRLAEPAVLTEETTRVRALGFHGKATVHPGELDVINRLLRPRTEELAQARRVVDAVAAADGGIAVLDGNMVGPPFARLARTTVARDDAWTSRFGRAGGTA